MDKWSTDHKYMTSWTTSIQISVRLHFQSTPNILWMEGLAGILKKDANFFGVVFAEKGV